MIIDVQSAIIGKFVISTYIKAVLTVYLFFDNNITIFSSYMYTFLNIEIYDL